MGGLYNRLMRFVRMFASGGATAVARRLKFSLQLIFLPKKHHIAAQAEYLFAPPVKKTLAEQRAHVFAKSPLISIVVPAYNTPPLFLRQLVDSVLAQTYANFELVIADASDGAAADLNAIILKYNDARIVYIKLAANLGIAGNTNAGFAAAKGEYIALCDHDDVLWPNALFKIVQAINDSGADFLYTDEAVMSNDLKHIRNAHLKPEFGREALLGCNYITHLTVFSRSLLSDVGGERAEFDGAQDHDLFLRMTEKAKRVVHVADVLYGWRAHAQSTAGGLAAKPYAQGAGARAIEAALERRGVQGEVVALESGAFRVKYALKTQAMLSVIIAKTAGDDAGALAKTLESVKKCAKYSNKELVIACSAQEAGDDAGEFAALAAQYGAKLVGVQTGPLAALLNAGAKACSGQFIMFLRAGQTLLTDGFDVELLSYLQADGVCAVGPKILVQRADGAMIVEHAGYILSEKGGVETRDIGLDDSDEGHIYRLATAQEVVGLNYSGMAVKAADFAAAGCFDESFGDSLFDADLCFKMRKSEKTCIWVPFAKLCTDKALSTDEHARELFLQKQQDRIGAVQG